MIVVGCGFFRSIVITERNKITSSFLPDIERIGFAKRLMGFERQVADVIGFGANEQPGYSVLADIEPEQLIGQVNTAPVCLALAMGLTAEISHKFLAGLVPIGGMVAEFLIIWLVQSYSHGDSSLSLNCAVLVSTGAYAPIGQYFRA